MSDPFRKYDGLAYREVRWRLWRQDMPEEIIEQTITALREHRKMLAIAKAKQRERDKQWGEIIQSLQHERKIVRSMVRYKTKFPAPERDQFVQDYFDLLGTLYEKLQSKWRLKRELPEHSHWTDYVPAHIKAAFMQASNDIPPRQKAKFKEPFRKADPIKLHNLRMGRLSRRINKELDTAITTLDMAPEDAKAARKEFLLREAGKRLKELPITAHVPTHWRDLVPDLMEDETQ